MRNISSANFGQLAVSGQRAGVHQKRRQHFREPVLARMHIEEKIRERPFEPRAESFVNREARARNFDRRVEIENPRTFANFPVRLRREIEFRRRAPAPHLDVIRRARPHRHTRVRNIRNRHQKQLQPLVQLTNALVAALNLVRHGFHLRQQRVALRHRRRKRLFADRPDAP